MAYCPNCGAAVEGRYCAKCGTSVDAAAPPPVPVPATGPTPAVAAAGMADNTAAALCYVLGFITGIIFLVLEPYNRNKLIRFHAFQSIFLNVVSMVFWWAATMIVPYPVWRLVGIVQLAMFALWIYMIVQAYQGKKVLLPVIGDLAAKQAG